LTAAAKAAAGKQRGGKRAEPDADAPSGSAAEAALPVDLGPAGLVFVEVPRAPPNDLSIFPTSESFAMVARSVDEVQSATALLEASPSLWDRLLARKLRDVIPELEEEADAAKRKARQRKQLGASAVSAMAEAKGPGNYFTRRARPAPGSYAEVADDTEEEG